MFIMENLKHILTVFTPVTNHIKNKKMQQATHIKSIIEDLSFLAEKADEPLVKIAYAMAITVVEQHEPKEPEIMLILNEGEEDESKISLAGYINSLEWEFESDFLAVINLLVGESCQYGADNIKRIS